MKISVKMAGAFLTVFMMVQHAESQQVANLNPVGAVFARQGGEMPHGTFRFLSAGFEVYTLSCSDDPFRTHKAALFYGVDNADKAKVDSLAPSGAVPTAMNCFVVKKEDGYIMFDTGLGGGEHGKAAERLSALGIDRGMIKAIYITHAHGDHTGGLIGNDGKAVFDNATLYIPEGEKDFMAVNSTDLYNAVLREYDGRIKWIHGGEMPGGVMCVDAPGHTPGHIAYRLGSLLFVGDILHAPLLQLVDPAICARYDIDREQSVITRKTLLDYAVCNSLTVLGAHVPANGVLF